MNYNLLYRYIKSLINLYGIVPKDKVIEIYNMQNEDVIDLDDIKKVTNKYFKKNSLYVEHEDYFMEDSMLEDGTFQNLKIKQQNKPYYVPEKEELLKYEEELFPVVTIEFKKLKDFIKKEFVNGDEELAEDICYDIRMECAMDFTIDNVMLHFKRRDITFKNEKQVQNLIGLIMELANNTRLWENNGHTPQEIFDKLEKPNLRPLPNKPLEVKKKKVGRNDPCPCGSGKKYKKCCLGKE